MTKPRHDHHVKRETVVEYAMRNFDEPRDTSTLRVRRKPWGYEICPQPIEYITGEAPDILRYGEGPTLVHGESGIIFSISSSPGDMFGPEGYFGLKTMEYLDGMIAARNIPPTQTVYSWLEDSPE